MVTESRDVPLRERLSHGVQVLIGAVVSTTAIFFVLPLLQAITDRAPRESRIEAFEVAEVPPPPAPEEEPPPPEEEPEEEPPELEPERQLLDLSQLELALNPSFGDGLLQGDFEIKLGGFGQGGADVAELFSLADLDQRPRAVYQTQPVQDAKTRRLAPATVYIIFIVDEQGRVENPRVQSSPDPAFERPALAAVRQWRFEPGKRGGQPVRFRMRVPITFPKS
ncbi:energy transducer TonB [Engelhardtia mirabilis]|uniref:Transport protein TonB n=1 Tax=Engelhardtia mirabilis TaxID=2528011 RepID=A0A518BGI3_9BACT|nr:transport protein TonB [Planctomycetes bacterium Pla133]QDV00419.1 transport protein TonB [Planctomycetes bacterium Pla86]